MPRFHSSLASPLCIHLPDADARHPSHQNTQPQIILLPVHPRARGCCHPNEVPPEPPVILDRWGRVINSTTIGPKEEGDDLLLTCRVVGGNLSKFKSNLLWRRRRRRRRHLQLFSLSFPVAPSHPIPQCPWKCAGIISQDNKGFAVHTRVG